MRRVQIGKTVLAIVIIFAGLNESSAIEFSPGEYQIESSLPAHAMGRSKQVIDKRCKHVKNIGCKTLSKPDCEILSLAEKDNKLSCEVKCSGSEIGDTKLKIEIAVYKDHFIGDIWLSENNKMQIIGTKVSSCSTGDNVTGNELASEDSEQTFLAYVKRKYQNLDLRVTSSDVVSTSDGKSGHFSLSGDIVPHKKSDKDLTAEPDRNARAREIARAFLEDELVLFDIKDLNEIKEFHINTDKAPRGDYTFIDYKRIINGIEVEGAYIQIVVGPSENISSVQSTLVAIPSATYEATTKAALSENEIISIVEADHNEQDIKRYPKNDIIKTFKKIALASAPYVIWDVHYRYVYRINAFTGEIISKRSAIKY
jgi:hypothetical protein